MLKHILTVPAFMIVTFAAQGLSHFVINKEHFDAIAFTRPEPIMPLGFTVMIIQGLILSYALASWRGKAVTLRDGVMISLAFGLFLVAYVALTEPAKYAVPSIPDWMVIEGTVGLVQFAVFGLALGFIHRRFA